MSSTKFIEQKIWFQTKTQQSTTLMLLFQMNINNKKNRTDHYQTFQPQQHQENTFKIPTSYNNPNTIFRPSNCMSLLA